jgi:CBS domain-containing protein
MPLNRQRKHIRDLMQIGVSTCTPDTPVADVARILLAGDINSIILLNPIDGNALGIVTQSDLLRVCSKDDHGKLTAMDGMQEEFPQLPPDIPISTAIQLMLDNNIQTYFLTHHSGGITYPAGYLSDKSILKYMAATEEEGELFKMGLDAERKPPLESFIHKRDAALRRISNK